MSFRDSSASSRESTSVTFSWQTRSCSPSVGWSALCGVFSPSEFDGCVVRAGALAEWLADHPVMLSSVLPLVLQALGNPDLSVSSVSTLKKICRECKYDLPPYASNIVAVSQVTHTHMTFVITHACAIQMSTVFILSLFLSHKHQEVLIKQIHKVSVFIYKSSLHDC